VPIELALYDLRTSPDTGPNICCWRTFPRTEAEYAVLPSGIDERLLGALSRRGIKALYSHQAQAFNLVRQGLDVTVVTPTASGKTICYNLPVLDSILKDSSSRALYVFPTKALSQDQVAELQQLITLMNEDIKTYTYDGDTPQSARRAIRQAGHIVVTNPDMLHTAILPHHTKWVKLFENLKYIVLDEIHQYRGVFGSHFANVLRRLLRITRFYGSRPQFICCSATIANPGELAARLAGRDTSVVDRNGAPRGAKHFVFYNPPVVNHQLGIRRSSLLEAQKITSRFLNHEVQTIVFTNSRVNTELLVTYLKNAVDRGVKDDGSVRGYRGGYLPNERRQIERDLRSGKVRAVVSTNALELGIDVGRLDACVMAGYPGTIASTWQRAGRAGRRTGESCAVLVASSNPLDQYIIQNPEFFFGNSPEHALINPNNLYILLNHTKCAAFELPFEDDEQFGVKDTANILSALEQAKLLHHSQGKWYWTAEDFPAEDISLRSASAESFVVIDTTNDPRVIAFVDRVSAPMLIHEEAIYIHESRQYHVDKLDYDEKKAYVHEVNVDYYTDANLAVTMRVLDVLRDRKGAPFTKGMGEVLATAMVTMFKKIKLYTHENVGAGRVHLPEEQMHTSACWLAFDPEVTTGLRPDQVQSALVGVSNLLYNIAPAFLMADPRDLRVVTEVKAPFLGLPAIYIYDAYPGGIGLAEKLYDILEQVVRACLDHVSTCGCEDGCPSCAGSVLEVGHEGKSLTKLALLRLAGARSDG
jgi:DEAD/DEAH box helicase domain-containing protein